MTLPGSVRSVLTLFSVAAVNASAAGPMNVSRLMSMVTFAGSVNVSNGWRSRTILLKVWK